MTEIYLHTVARIRGARIIPCGYLGQRQRGWGASTLSVLSHRLCVCVCVRACVRTCLCCVRILGWRRKRATRQATNGWPRRKNGEATCRCRRCRRNRFGYGLCFALQSTRPRTEVCPAAAAAAAALPPPPSPLPSSSSSFVLTVCLCC